MIKTELSWGVSDHDKKHALVVVIPKGSSPLSGIYRCLNLAFRPVAVNSKGNRWKASVKYFMDGGVEEHLCCKKTKCFDIGSNSLLFRNGETLLDLYLNGGSRAFVAILHSYNFFQMN